MKANACIPVERRLGRCGQENTSQLGKVLNCDEELYEFSELSSISHWEMTLLH